MNELDKNLLTGETILFETRKHWFSPIRQSLIAALLILGAIALRWLSPAGGEGFLGSIGGSIGGLMTLAGNVMIVVGIAWVGFEIFAFFSAHFGVTNMRVLRYEGVFRRRSSETLLSMVTDVRLAEPALGRMLGFGDVRILTSSGAAGEDRFTTIRGAAALRTSIQEQMAVGRTVQSAPIIPAMAAPVISTMAPPSAPAATPADEAAATLERLADMHTQGLITDAEYEAKKTEILGRI